MTWFKVDDNFTDHPKTEDLPDAAVAMWTRGGSWSARHLTDGFVPERKARKLCDDPDGALKALLDSGLWELADGGFQFHDWSDYQPTREEEMASRKANSMGGAIGNHRRWHVEKGKVDPRCQYCRGSNDRGTDRGTDQSGDRGTDRSSDRGTESVVNRPDPTRPVPSPLSSKSKTGSGDLDLSLTKQDQSNGSNQELDEYDRQAMLRRKWQGTGCPEHRGPSILSCSVCGAEHKSASYWTRHDWSTSEFNPDRVAK